MSNLSMSTMKVADLFVKCLENEGVEYIFAIPGEENLHLLESIRKSNIHPFLGKFKPFPHIFYFRFCGLERQMSGVL